jgi:hypothetical protein
MNFHSAQFQMLQRLEQADVASLHLVVFHKLWPSTHDPIIVRPASKPHLPLLAKSLKPDAPRLTSQMFVNIFLGDALFTDLENGENVR